MAQKSKKRSKGSLSDIEQNEQRLLKEETLKVIYSLFFFLISIFLTLSAFNKAGPVGLYTYNALRFLLGIGYILLPILFIFLGLLFIRSLKRSVSWLKVSAAFFVLLCCLSLISILLKDNHGIGDGGFIGNIVSYPFLRLFDFWVSLIFLSGLLIVGLVIALETHIKWERLAFWRRQTNDLEEDESDIYEAPIEKPAKARMMPEEPKIEEPEPEEAPEPISKTEKDIVLDKSDKKSFKKAPGEFIIASNALLGKKYVPPPLSLLEEDKGKPGVGDIKANANIIKRTLQNFGINVEMDEISIGPSVTRYALKPAEGVKLSRIVGLQNDLSLALAAHPIRIEAPIPGKSLVGIEIPNSTKTTVGLGTLFTSDEFRSSEKPLLVALGKGISGKSHFGNLAKMPHLLIAGATGSGKSVTIHAMLTSLLYRNSPENLKFIMIDPKRVELTLYNNIPHLLTPVITDAKKAILALKWATKEMDRRYDLLETEKVRDIESYHKNILSPALEKMEKEGVPKTDDPDTQSALPETMPYIVIIIDELADLMQAYPRELESAIVRLAQMSRAVGIHLMLSTQRPSVNVITGLIKANVPSRVALQVTSQIDSRTILDTSGAEKLLGAGDMLYMSGDMSKPQRIQSAYLSESELKKVVKYLIDTYADTLPTEINLTESAVDKNSIFESTFDDDAGEEDDLYEEARDIVIKAGKASTSYLQRKLRIGYARAARLIDMLEERGVIGPGEGAKPREVIGGGATAQSDESESAVTEETL